MPIDPSRRAFAQRLVTGGLGLGGLAALGCATGSQTQTRCPEPPPGAEPEPEPEPELSGSDDPFSNLRAFQQGIEPPSAAEYAARRAAAAEALGRAGAACVVLEAGVGQSYLTGLRWGQSERPLLFCLDAEGRGTWSVPSFERGTFGERFGELRVEADRVLTWDEEQSPYTTLHAALEGKAKPTRKRPMLIDADARGFVIEGLRRAGAADASRVDEALIAGLRMVKSEAELVRLRRANEATKAALELVADLIVPGMRESDARPLIREAQAAAGLQNIWVLALFGPNAAYPHGTPNEHVLREGDLILVDTGGSLHGYQSDITRTWALGQAPDEARRAFDAVLAAQRRSMEAIRPGAVAGEVDALARAAIREAGFGEGYSRFTHRLGHGIGMQGHERPYLRKDNPQVLAPGMTMSNEPGVYVPGQFGVRIEDIVAVTETGYEVFGPRVESLDKPFG